MQNQFKGLVKSIAIYGFGNISIKLIGLILLPLFTNVKILSVNEYGVLGVLETTTLIITSLFSLSLYSAYIRWYWDKDYVEKRKSILFSCYLVLLFIGIVLSTSGLIGSKTLSLLLFDKEDFYLPLRLMIVAASSQFLIDLTLSQMRVEEKPSLYVTTNVIRLFVSLTATILLLKYAHRGLVGIYEAQLIGNIVFILITIPYIIKRTKARVNFHVISEMLNYSIPLALAAVSNVLLSVFDRYVLNYKSTLLNVGIYTLGFKIANTTKVFIVSSVQLALAPTFFKLMDHPDHKAIYSRIMTWFTILVVFVSLFLSLFGLEIIKVFSKSTIYWSAYQVIPVLSLGIVFAMLKDVSVVGLQITKKTKIIGVMLFGVAVLNLVINLMLVPRFGTMGAAYSSFVSQFIFFILIFWFAQKHYSIPYRLDKISIIILTGIAVYIAGSLTNNLTTEVRIPLKLILFIGFPLLLFLFRIFDKKEIALIKSFIDSIKKFVGNTSYKEIDEQASKIEEP